MKRKNLFVLLTFFVLFLLIGAAILMINAYVRNNRTSVTSLTYSNEKGQTIVYYMCATSRSNNASQEYPDIDTDAISAVIDPDEAESTYACTVSGLPAVICQKNGRAYLCWTITPEISSIIEYDPAAIREEDIFRMAESVPANTASSVAASEP